METDLQEFKETLKRENENFRVLVEDHATCEVRLQELQGKILLNEQEKIEEVNIKKKKLHLKDRMEAMMREHRNGKLPAVGSK